jgi:hypothetical protein
MLNGWSVENYSTLGYKYVFIDNLLLLFGGAFILHVKGRRRLCYWEELVALYRALAEIILMDVAGCDAVLCLCGGNQIIKDDLGPETVGVYSFPWEYD